MKCEVSSLLKWLEVQHLNLSEPLKNSHWNLFRRLSNAIFINFLLKANQQFVEILPTTYIFQSRSIYNITGKVVWSDHDQALYWYVKRSQLYTANQHLFLFRFRWKSKINPLELHDNKIVRLTEFLEGLEISSATQILCNSVENMTA